MMKAKKLAPVMRGLSAIMASVLALSVVGTGIADGYRARLDQFLGTRGCCLLIAKVHPDVGTND